MLRNLLRITSNMDPACLRCASSAVHDDLTTQLLASSEYLQDETVE